MGLVINSGNREIIDRWEEVMCVRDGENNGESERERERNGP